MAKAVESHRNPPSSTSSGRPDFESALVALNYGDIREELEKGEEHVKVPVYPEMKERVSDACKGEIPYYTFAHPLASPPAQALPTEAEGQIRTPRGRVPPPPLQLEPLE